jgi:hypothetical protein
MQKYVYSSSIAAALIAASASAAFAQSQPWNQVLAGEQRFVLLSQFVDEAVLDKETGLTWQKSSTETFDILPLTSHYCANVTVGNRRGWRLPTLQELKSVTDLSESSPTLTAGHPFVNVDLTRSYWSSTVTLNDPGFVWTMAFNVGEVTRARACAGATCAGVPPVERAAWCRRGGSGAGAQ